MAKEILMPKKTYREMLEECYKKAIEADDVNLAVEIAERLKTAPVGQVTDERIQKFIEELDKMVSEKDDPTNENVTYRYQFEYGGQKFEVKII
jgi:Zn-dependent peptidase ImmA (M78 family)